MLEDNLRTPSGVSYMLENRKMMMRLFPELFADAVDPAGRALSGPAAREPARASRPTACDNPTVARADAGRATTRAYFEHAFLAQQMGVELVEGQDLFVAERHGLHAHDARARSAST